MFFALFSDCFSYAYFSLLLKNPGVIPVSYLVDKEDNIDKVFVGDASESELRRRIEKLLGV